MSFFFRIRDKFNPPINKIKKANVKSGDYILDYGCGSGSYTIAVAEEIGTLGKVYAADIHPLAIKKVKKKASKKGLKNIDTIITDCKTGLKNNSIDVVICFDTLHVIGDQECILREFHRVLKPNSVLSLDDHHMQEDEILSKITKQGLFDLAEKKEKIYNFTKIEK